MRKFANKLSYANVMSTIAVFLVLGGGAAFAAGLAKNSVGSKQLKRNAVTAAKIKNDAVTGAKVNEATLGAVPIATSAKTADVAKTADAAKTANVANSATTATTASTLAGQPPSAFAIRSAAFTEEGEVIPSQSDGITQGNVTSPTPGLVCISGLNPAPKTAVASLNFESFFDFIFVQVNPTEGGCAGKQVAIATEEEGVGFQPNPFSVIIH
jgi:hypothetical protein